MATKKKYIDLPALSEEETNGCLARGGTKFNGRLSVGFMAELALAKYLESQGVKGAVMSCIIQQSRNVARNGADMTNIDAKTSECKSVLQAEGYSLQAKTWAVEKGPDRFAFVPFIQELGHHVLMGWATKEEFLKGELITKYDDPLYSLRVSELRLPATLLEKPKPKKTPKTSWKPRKYA